MMMASLTAAGWEDLGDTMDMVLDFVKNMNEECLEQEQVSVFPHFSQP